MSQRDTAPADGQADREAAAPRPAAPRPDPTPELTPERVLSLWHGVMLHALRDAHPDLTARQFALLLHVYKTPPPHTVRGLAAELKMSKPAVTRALDRLGAHGLLRRKRDEADKRSVLVQRTVKGSVYLREFADMAARLAREV